MIGTSTEILDYLSHHWEYAKYMSMSRQRLAGLRQRLRTGTLANSRKEELLENLQKRLESLRVSSVNSEVSVPMVRCKRPSYTMPAIVRDHRGRFFPETSFLKMVAHEKMMSDLNLKKVCSYFDCGRLASFETLREALNRKGWNIFEQRMVLPSIWEVVTDDTYATTD